MTYLPRAAVTAIAAFALCACATSQTTTPSSQIVIKAPTPVTNSNPVPVKMADMDVADTAMPETAMPETAMPATTPPETTSSADMTDVDTTASNETLLYGAMTKYELMKFVEVVSAANLQSALEGPVPLTVFAPNDQAFEFARLDADADIPMILKGHIVEGAMDAEALKAAVAENGAPLKMTSLSGQELTVYVMGDAVKIAGPNGTLATVTQADMMQSNGVMHQISGVLKPK